MLGLPGAPGGIPGNTLTGHVTKASPNGLPACRPTGLLAYRLSGLEESPIRPWLAANRLASARLVVPVLA